MSKKVRFARPSWRRIGFAALLLAVLAGGVAAYFFCPLPYDRAPALASLDGDPVRGEYIATIGNCAACHTVPGGAPYAGGVKFVTDFGTIYSTNITSDDANGIGGWSFAAFHRALKHGIGDGGEHLYPAFPYTSFSRMTDDDIASLYLYFQTVEPVAEGNRENEMSFPFGYRDLLHFWKRMFHSPRPFTNSPALSSEGNEGAYLVEAVAHCAECHTPRGMLGNANRSRMFQGGTYVDATRRGTYRQWAAVDLTPGAHGLPTWTEQDMDQYLATGINRHAVVHGPMNEVIEATRQLKPADRKAISRYFSELKPSPTRWDLSLPSWGVDDGEVVYTVHCGTCHLPEGDGDPTLGVSLQQNPIIQAEDPSSLINVILYGPDLPPPPFSVDRSQMKPFGRRLSDEDIAALATYLRSNFGNNASSVSASQVVRQR
ncbi:cytochrome c [Pontixanthobacter aquaemixtae]|uniref:C-type cytochrome n=1 Tax=Pontixanthobacter aquaemixtae TaxID=1958940 RepID=A0A844ZQ79_9SPHN|nr:cytochrome c [Pontixanthobacter aquaemixtae]MXO89898.1 c-type cytochrome [Pontixanthobacter aquaemixtae]